MLAEADEERALGAALAVETAQQIVGGRAAGAALGGEELDEYGGWFRRGGSSCGCGGGEGSGAGGEQETGGVGTGSHGASVRPPKVWRLACPGRRGELAKVRRGTGRRRTSEALTALAGKEPAVVRGWWKRRVGAGWGG